MKQIVKLSSLLIFSLFIFKSILGAEKNYFNEAVNLFEKKKNLKKQNLSLNKI